jgi:hypothetical protein
MKSLLRALLGSAGAALCLIAAPLQAAALTGAPTDAQQQAAQAAAAAIAGILAAQCPVAAPGDEQAFTACRRGLYQQTSLRARLDRIVLWGRQRDPNVKLVDTNLTQFAPDVLTGMYLPLFMFDGRYRVQYVEREGLYQLRFATAFRNRLAPGQFPYPFWHDAEKWSMYQGANEVLMWWDPVREQVKAAQFTVHGEQTAAAHVDKVPAPAGFDGHWMWTDAQGRTQPKVTLFDGLFRADNPYLPQMDGAYRALALRLREGQCDQCHTPDNRDQAKRLVLLQTPAHAAGEIDRLLKAVREDRMPRDEAGIEQPLDPQAKQALLKDGEAFAALVKAAQRWEADKSGERTHLAGTPQPAAQ